MYMYVCIMCMYMCIYVYICVNKFLVEALRLGYPQFQEFRNPERTEPLIFNSPVTWGFLPLKGSR